jgi:hypothetical protein
MDMVMERRAWLALVKRWSDQREREGGRCSAWRGRAVTIVPNDPLVLDVTIQHDECSTYVKTRKSSTKSPTNSLHTARQNSHHHETIPDNSTVWNPPSSISTLLITKIQYPKLTVLCFCSFYVFMIFWSMMFWYFCWRGRLIAFSLFYPFLAGNNMSWRSCQFCSSHHAE